MKIMKEKKMKFFHQFYVPSYECDCVNLCRVSPMYYYWSGCTSTTHVDH